MVALVSLRLRTRGGRVRASMGWSTIGSGLVELTYTLYAKNRTNTDTSMSVIVRRAGMSDN